MTMRRMIEVITCDRCKIQFERPGTTMTDVSFMVLRNGSGSRDSTMAEDYCHSCTASFLEWRKGTD